MSDGPDWPPFREVSFPPAQMRIDRRGDGVICLEPVLPLQDFRPSIPLELAAQAAAIPDRGYLAERPAPGAAWSHCSYAQMKSGADAVAQWLLERGITRDRSVLILSGNSIRHAMVKFGAMAARIPVCPLSASYTIGTDPGRLREAIRLTRPAVIFAEQARLYARALAGLGPVDALVVSDEPARLGGPAIPLREVLDSRPDQRVAASIAAIDPDEPCCYMLSSGSTGPPRAVIHTQRMIGANLAQGRQILAKTAGWDQVMLDWLPWSHVAGTFNQMGVLSCGGTLYIDGGRPLPGLFEQTLANLREMPVQFYTNVPLGFAMLADALAVEAPLRRTFFSRLRLMLYGGAGLPQALYERLQHLAVDTIGRRIFCTTGYGATETTSGCMSIWFPTERVGIGLPMPGLQLKLVPLEDGRHELRLRGPMITPGYLGAPEQNASLFDAEGYLQIRDTARFHDPADLQQGLAFAGRLAEEFKLATGAWVAAGNLRAELLQATDPLLAELLVCGEGRDYVAVLAWLRPEACRQAIGPGAPDDPALLAAHPELQARLRAAIEAHNRAHPGASQRVARMAFLRQPPSLELGEVSDKGTVNQAAARQRRQAELAGLYADPPDATVLSFA
ncbi:MAG: acyl-CoA synthetase [Gammaproteobacteria bacterium]|nr:MAG: acyl-CoA synthetase [Gammaproteobacteria bacterium]